MRSSNSAGGPLAQAVTSPWDGVSRSSRAAGAVIRVALEISFCKLTKEVLPSRFLETYSVTILVVEQIDGL